jgi:DNA-directed RNA polymerase subunit RPC12/RpoP
MPKYIKLDDAIATLHKYFPLSFDRQDAEDDLKSIPDADVKEVKRGEWVEDFMVGEGVYRCTNCDDKFVTLEGTPYDNRLFYCPFCGAKMDGKESGDGRTDTD